MIVITFLRWFRYVLRTTQPPAFFLGCFNTRLRATQPPGISF